MVGGGFTGAEKLCGGVSAAAQPAGSGSSSGWVSSTQKHKDPGGRTVNIEFLQVIFCQR